VDGKLVSSDMSVTWGTIKYGCIPVPGLFHMIMEVWESPMHVAVIRCVLNQRQSMLHVLDSCYESGIPHLRIFAFPFDVLEFAFCIINSTDICECGGIVERSFRSSSCLRHVSKVGNPG